MIIPWQPNRILATSTIGDELSISRKPLSLRANTSMLTCRYKFVRKKKTIVTMCLARRTTRTRRDMFFLPSWRQPKTIDRMLNTQRRIIVMISSS